MTSLKTLAVGLVLMALIGACDVSDSSIPAGNSPGPDRRGVHSTPSLPREAGTLGAVPTATPSPVAVAQGDTTPAPANEPTPQPPQPIHPLDDTGVEADITDGGGDRPVILPEPGAVDAFLAGYRFGGGDPAWEEHLINDVIPCESEWELDPPGYHLGLAQFDPGTWVTAKCSPDSDYRDPWEQGCVVARWMSMIAPNYGARAGWPWCWHAGGE